MDKVPLTDIHTNMAREAHNVKHQNVTHLRRFYLAPVGFVLVNRTSDRFNV
jgi:hypothetical protein